MQNSDKNNCNSGLFGNWRTKPISDGIYHDITDECLMYINGSYPYSFPDENTLHYGKDTFYRRISAEPYTLIGEWLDDNTGEQLIFFEDGRLVSSSPDDDYEYLTTYTATDTHITTRELRVRLDIEGLNISYTVLDSNTVYQGTFEIISSDKWTLKLEGMDEVTYYRE